MYMILFDTTYPVKRCLFDMLLILTVIHNLHLIKTVKNNLSIGKYYKCLLSTISD